MRDAIFKMMTDVVERMVDMSIGEDDDAQWDVGELINNLLPIIPIEEGKLSAVIKSSKNKNELKHGLKECAVQLYEAKEAEFPQPEQIREIERVCLLKVIDQKWMNHIDDMDQHRQGIGLQAYGNRDPKIEYKMLGYEMFEEMTEGIQEGTLRL